MAEWSGFFDAHKVGDSWDRTYLAEDFAKFFAPLIGNGIFAGRSNELQVFQDVPASMSVILSSGQSWIEGYGYVNDSDLKISVDPADGVLGRIDRIVNQWSSVDRRIRTVWKKGTPAVNPVAPPLRWDADYKELNICTLDVSAGLSAITQDKIRDTRANSSVCGWVTGLIDQVDTSTLFAQWESAYEKEFTEQRRAWEEFFKDIQLDLGIPVPSPDKANHVLAVDSNGGYILSEVVNNFTTTKEGLVADARALKTLNDSKLPAVESEDHPGCYYRTVDNQNEWLNPPMMPGVEYRTTERAEGKIIYAKRIVHTPSSQVGSSTAAASYLVPHGVSNFGNVVRTTGYFGDNYISPHFNSVGGYVVLQRVYSEGILLMCYKNTTSSTFVIDIYYTKTA